MTGFAMPPFAVSYDARWVAVDLEADLRAWARRAAREVLARSGGRPSRREERRIAAVLEAAGAVARKAQDASIALLLYPDVNERVRAVVRFCPVDLGDREEDEAWAGILETLAPDLPGLPSAEVTDIVTPAGLCRRICQRVAVGEGSERPVYEQLAYVWVFLEQSAGVIMTTAFTDLVEAGRWRPALDALAAGAEREPPVGGPRHPAGLPDGPAGMTGAPGGIAGLAGPPGGIAGMAGPPGGPTGMAGPPDGPAGMAGPGDMAGPLGGPAGMTELPDGPAGPG